MNTAKIMLLNYITLFASKTVKKVLSVLCQLSEKEPYSLIIQLHRIGKAYYAPETTVSFSKVVLFQCGYN